MFSSGEEQSKRFPKSLFVHRRLFFQEVSFMGTELNFESSLSRRSFLRRSALFMGVGALSVEAFIAACSSTPATSSVASASVNSMPPTSNPGAVFVFNQQVKAFEQAYANEKIVGTNDPYDPTTYFARLAAGQQEDVGQNYLTHPPPPISTPPRSRIPTPPSH